MEKRFVFAAVLTVLSVLCATLQVVTKDELMDSNHDIVRGLQAESSSAVELFFNAVSDVTKYIFLVLPPADYVLLNTQRGLVVACTGFIALAATDVLKGTYAQPRPFWVFEDIEAFRCSRGWGAPSGHAAMAGSVLVLYSLVQKKPWFVLMTVGLLLLVSLDRVYLGVHSYFQVALGLVLSSTLALYIYLGYSEPLLSSKQYKVLFVTASLFLFVVSVTLYFARDPFWEHEWTVNFEEECEGSLSEEDGMIRSLAGSTILFWGLGMFTGYSLAPLQRVLQHSWRSCTITVILIIVLLVVELVLEQLINSYLERLVLVLLYILVRYSVGFTSGYFIPLLLKRLFPSL